MSEMNKNNIKIDKGILKDSQEQLVKFQNNFKGNSDNLLIADNPMLLVKFTFNKIPDQSNNTVIRKMYQKLKNIESDEKLDNGKIDKILSKYPIPIQIKQPIQSNKQSTKALLITRDPQRTFKDQQNELKEEIEEDYDIITKIISMTKLKKRIGGEQDLKKIINTQDLILADSLIYKKLPNLLGQQFYKSKKYPVRVYLDESNPSQLKQEIISKIYSTSVMFSNGTQFSVRAGRLTMNIDQIQDNLEDVISGLQIILGDQLDIMKIQIEFERSSGNEVWPSMPVQYNLSKREVNLYKDEKEQFENLIKGE